MSYSVFAVANAFIELSARNDTPITNMKLQKLVYFAHGFALALNQEGLFEEPVRAFQWGPVIPELYNAVKHYGRNPITEPIPYLGPSIDLDDPTCIASRVVRAVWVKYGSYSAAQLSTITHRDGTPWSAVWSRQEYGVIPNSLIKEHYDGLLQAA